MSVLLAGLKQDWNFYNIFLTKKDSSWIQTTCSSTLDQNGSCKMGLKFERREGSIFVLIRGCTTVCLKAAGTKPEDKQVFIRSKMKGPTESKTSLRRREGKQAEGQLVERICLTASVREEREEREMGSDCWKIAGWQTGEGERGVIVDKSAGQSEDTLSVKKLKKLSQCAGERPTGHSFARVFERVQAW